ncbi:MAG: hypothetical protein FWC78_03450 [Defluviitaleaceae bacterium]|nr:hypothetical protein [Defluviitaleaceae bacterium]
MNISLNRLLDCIGEIEDIFIIEAETAELAIKKANKRKKIVKYSAAGLAVSAAVAVAYFMLRPKAA